MINKFKHAYEVDNYTFKNKKNDDFKFRLISILLSIDEYNPNQSTYEMSPKYNDVIVDLGNHFYTIENESQNNDENIVEMFTTISEFKKYFK